MSFDANKNMITAAFVQQFHDSFEIASQQKDSRLQACVQDRGKITGTAFTINDMGSIEMNEITTRFGDTVWDVPEAGTRQALMADYGLFIPVEKRDLRKLIASPQGPYMNLTVAACNRKKDDVIYNALINPVPRKTEDKGAFANVSLPSSQMIVANGQPMTKTKLIAAKAMFRRNECDEQNGEELFITYNADMLSQILADTTLTSADFMAVKMLQEGKLADNWLGFKWIAYEKLKKDATTKAQTAVAWCKSAVHFGTGADYNTDIGPRRDKNNTIQISVDASYGAGRANESKVVTLDFVA
ncbi:TPA: phage capsid protein [Salmonella enterica subsp. enterica serovar Birkenhead]